MNKSHYSLLDGLSKPEDIVKRTLEINNTAGNLTDHGTISGTIQFHNEMREAGLKPILGNELYISPNNKIRPNNHLPILAKNKKGWNQLIQITSRSNNPDNFYYKPRLSLKELAGFTENSIIGFSGHLGSHISNALQQNMKEAEKTALYLQDVFGKGNFFLEVQLMDAKLNPMQQVISEQVRELSNKIGIPCIATPDAHYAFKEQAIDQRVLLCTNMHVTMQEANQENFLLHTFFKSDNYHIPSYEEMVEYGHTQEELENTNLIASMVEEYDVTGPPILPPFDCPGGIKPDVYMRKLCNEGLKRIKKENNDRYNNRMLEELKVLEGAGLSSYFLIIRDIVEFVNKNGWLIGPGRGSVSGCLVAYLLGITNIDSLKYNLIFSRFYNEGRNTKERVSMPDIDVDIPAKHRDQIINYIKEKYGENKVAQMVTYQTMMGRKGLKDVFRAYGNMSFDEMNMITRNIPDKAKIAGELQKMKEDTGESSVIQWALENMPEKFKDWVELKNGKCKGPYADRFEQAIRLEGTKSSQSKHAAGIVIGHIPLEQICPMIYDTKEKIMIAGLEMNDIEALGLIKLDILGLKFLDKVDAIANILRTGDV